MTTTKHKERGFTLIEIVLALMVASMGLLVIMGLFAGGLSAQQTTVDETQAALFAEEVLQSFRALAPGSWSNLAALSLPAPHNQLWQTNAPAKVVVGSPVKTLSYIFNGSEDIQEFALRYLLEVKDIGPNLKSIRLEVWNGEFGAITADTASRVYYTEIFHR